MVEKEKDKEQGFIGKIKKGLGHVSNILSASVIPIITEGFDKVMNNIDDRLLLIEKRIFRKMSSLIIIGLGGIFLIFALLFFLIDYAGWSKAVAFFAIGIIIFIVGLLLQIRETAK